jgi:hypothetical protein
MLFRGVRPSPATRRLGRQGRAASLHHGSRATHSLHRGRLVPDRVRQVACYRRHAASITSWSARSGRPPEVSRCRSRRLAASAVTSRRAALTVSFLVAVPTACWSREIHRLRGTLQCQAMMIPAAPAPAAAAQPDNKKIPPATRQLNRIGCLVHGFTKRFRGNAPRSRRCPRRCPVMPPDVGARRG